MFPVPKIMGVLNVTPDSFSDGGDFLDKNFALKRAEKMIIEGVDMIDIGAESTAPGNRPILVKEEWNRLKNILPPLFQLCRKKTFLFLLIHKK